MSFATCSHCGWVHMAATRAQAEKWVRDFNEFYSAQPPGIQEHFGSRCATVVAYEQCYRCGAPHTEMREYKMGDLDGVHTVQPVIFEPSR